MKIAVLGGGHGCYAAAADLTEAGHEVRLWRRDAGALQPVLDDIRQRLREHGDPPVYLSLDIDCLDPAYAPGTGTPEPAGLTTSQVMTFLEESADLSYIGMDCVEVSPPFDHAEITSLAAAHFIWTYLCGRARALQRGVRAGA